MANSLGYKLSYGELVVIRKNTLFPKFHPIAHRTGYAVGGFGMNHETMGRKLFVQCLDRSPGEHDTFHGADVNAEETKRLHEAIAACDPQGFENFTAPWRDAFWRTYTILRCRTALARLTEADLL